MNVTLSLPARDFARARNSTHAPIQRALSVVIPARFSNAMANPLIIISQRNKKCTSLFLPGSRFYRAGCCARSTGAKRSMLYQAYQAHSDIMVPVRTWAGMAINAFAPIQRHVRAGIKNLTAAYELISRAGLTHVRPPFGIETVTVGNEEIPVTEQAAHVTPFGTLLRFTKAIGHAAAARIAGRAAVRAFCHPAAQHRKNAAARA